MSDNEPSQTSFNRIMLKISGEALMGDQGYGISPPTIERIAAEVKSVHDMHVQICMVIGGGNIFRGLQGSAQGMERTTADYMGMLATVMNALALGDTMDKAGLTPRVMSAIGIERIVEPYVRPKALQYLEEGKVVIFAAGTGNPFFTTDTTAALRAVEIEAGVLLKGTHSGTDGIYTDDPRTNPEATKLEEVSYLDVLNQGLRAMDSTAITLCMDNNLPIVMFDLTGEGNVRSLLEGGSVGTLVR